METTNVKAKLILVDGVFRAIKSGQIIGTTDWNYAKSFADVCGKLLESNCKEVMYDLDLFDLVQEEYNQFDFDARVVYRRQLQESLANMFFKGIEFNKSIMKKQDPNLIDSMALRYAHDFGLMDEIQKESIRTMMRQIWEEVVGVGFYKGKNEWDINIVWEKDEPQRYMKRNVIRRLDNGEEIEWTCFFDNGWWGSDGVHCPNVIHWERLPVLQADGCLIINRCN